MTVADLPKVELHLHLEGCAPPAFIRTLAAEQGRDVSALFDEEGHYRWRDFAEFLQVYAAACEMLRGPEEFRRLTESVLAERAADGVVYAEIFLAPDLCGGGDAGAWTEHLAAILEGARAAEAAHGILCRFIPTAIRHHGPEAAERAARLTAETLGPMVTGFGMGGEERHLAPADFARAFAIAREAGLGLTVHAGEICGPESVRAALDALRPARIGHGVRAAESPGLVARLAAERVVLEVNPGSNLALGLYPDWAAHPVARLRRAGVPVTLSTDDPPYFHTSLRAEYVRLAEAFGWTAADFAAINETAIAAAFCDEATRAAVRARLRAGGAPEGDQR